MGQQTAQPAASPKGSQTINRPVLHHVSISQAKDLDKQTAEDQRVRHNEEWSGSPGSCKATYPPNSNGNISPGWDSIPSIWPDAGIHTSELRSQLRIPPASIFHVTPISLCDPSSTRNPDFCQANQPCLIRDSVFLLLALSGMPEQSAVTYPPTPCYVRLHPGTPHQRFS